jgi:hypothetical protein
MTAHLNDDQIRGYRERSLGPAELLAASEHLGGCADCRARIVSTAALSTRIRAMRIALRAEDASAHLEYDQIAAYVDGKMDAASRSSLELHASECESCAADLQAIEAMPNETAARAAVHEKRNPWAWRPLFGWRIGLAIAVVACAVFLSTVFTTPPHSNVAQVKQKPAALAKSGSPAEPASTIRDGKQVVSITPGGGVDGLPAIADADRAFLEKALIERQIEPAASLADLPAKHGVLMGAPAEHPQVGLLAPLGTVVESDRPVFRWQPLAGALYRVSVFNAAYDAVAHSDWMSSTLWQVTTPLQRGSRYSWQLGVRWDVEEFTMPAVPAPEARFRVLGAAQEVEIARARSEWGGSHLVLGLLYARAGLIDDAQREMQTLREQNPDSDVVAGLLKSIQRSNPAPMTTKGAQ